MNDELCVELIDPAEQSDRHRLGTRFCWGGYIWQVRDAAGNPLLSGPEWPDTAPDPFNGQGLPESFRVREYGTNRSLTVDETGGFAIGVGDLEVDSGGTVRILRPCSWHVSARESEVLFETTHDGIGLSCSLARSVRIEHRTVISTSCLINTGARTLPLHWFAHPFLPLTDRTIRCRLPDGAGVAENTGFSLDRNGELTLKRPFKDARDGHMETITLTRKSAFCIEASHPSLDYIRCTADFAPSRCVVWANGNTFSIEPYIMTELAPGESREWRLSYAFGPSSRRVR